MSATVAQSTPGILSGIVTAQGHPVSRARLQLVAHPTRRVTSASLTDARGGFSMAGLPPGMYTLQCAVKGRQPAQAAHVEIRSQAVLYVQIRVEGLESPARAGARFEFLDQTAWWGTEFGEVALERLPNARNIWQLLQSQEPSTVTDRFDIAGLETATLGRFGALGASWTENQYLLNGLDVTDPYIPGLPLMYPEVDEFAAVEVLTGAKPPSAAASGQDLALYSLRPDGALHGAARIFYSSRDLETDNFNSRLARFAFPGPERMNHLVDASVQLGGRLPASVASVPFLVSLSRQAVAKDLGGFPLPITARAYAALVDATVLSRASQKFDFLYSGQHVSNSAENAGAFTAPSATTRANHNFHQFQGRWVDALSPSKVISASAAVGNGIIASELQPGATGVNTVDLPRLSTTGSAQPALSGVRTRLEAQAMAQTVIKDAAGSHSLTVGFDWQRSSIHNRWDAASATEQILVEGSGSEVVRWNTPVSSRQHVQNIGEFIQDAWRPPARWIALSLGVRADSSSGGAQSSAAAVSWDTLQPRAGVVVRLPPRGMSVQVHWARYGHLIQGRYLDFGDPAALGGEVFRWNDRNEDRSAQPNEIGPLLRKFGGPYSSISRRLARPFTDEISFGMEQNFGRRLTAAVRFFRRDDHRLIALDNVGVPLSDYVPTSVQDPGDDGRLGTADDRPLTLYNRKLAALGRDFLVLANLPGLHASYKGLEARLIKHLLQRWEFSASFTGSRTLATSSPGNSVFDDDTGFVGTLGADPNTFVLAQGRTHFDRAFTGKLTAYYMAPWGFRFGAVASYYDGLPFGRLLFVTGFNQGPFFVRATPVGHPGGFQTELNSSFDARISRDFNVCRGRLSAYIDVFNLLNANSNTLENDLTGPKFLLRVPLAVESPRTARVGLRLSF